MNGGLWPERALAAPTSADYSPSTHAQSFRWADLTEIHTVDRLVRCDPQHGSRTVFLERELNPEGLEALCDGSTHDGGMRVPLPSISR